MGACAVGRGRGAMETLDAMDLIDFPDDVSDTERTRYREKKQLRRSPNEYLQLTPGQKQKKRLALAALMGMDDDTSHQQRIYISQAVAFHCPHVLEDSANLRYFLRWGHDKAIGVALSVLSKTKDSAIGWDYYVASQAITRKYYLILFLPSNYKKRNDLWLKAMQVNPRIFERAFEEWAIEQTAAGEELVLQIVQIATESENDELRKQFERILQRDGRSQRLKEYFGVIARRVKPSWDNIAFQTFLTCITAADLRRGRQGHVYNMDNGGDHPLQLMICGEETSVALKRKIAQFLGADGATTDVANYSKLKQAWSVVGRYYGEEPPRRRQW